MNASTRAVDASELAEHALSDLAEHFVDAIKTCSPPAVERFFQQLPS